MDTHPHPHIPNIDFGKWKTQLDYLDYHYQKLATRLIQFFQEIGKDPYDRYFAIEEMITMAIDKKITGMSIDYIYRHYVYYIMAKHTVVDEAFEEDEYLFNSFLVLYKK